MEGSADVEGTVEVQVSVDVDGGTDAVEGRGNVEEGKDDDGGVMFDVKIVEKANGCPWG